jgi:hypothetical protein
MPKTWHIFPTLGKVPYIRAATISGKASRLGHFSQLARGLLCYEQSHWRPKMTSAPFFTTRLGRAALVSIAAMLAMNLVVLARHVPELPGMSHVSSSATGINASVSAVTGGIA